MTTPDEQQPARGRTRLVVAVSAIVVVVALVVVLVVSGVARGRSTPAVSPEPTSGTTLVPSTPASSTAPSTTPSGSAQTHGPGPADPTEGADPSTAPTTGTTPATEPPVALDEPATPGVGVTADITGLRAVTGTADGVGEVTAPAVAFTIRLRNTTAKALSLATAVVSVSAGSDDTPADEYVSARKALPATAAAGATVNGTYEFAVPRSDRGRVTISLDLGSGAPVVAFVGSAPR